MSAVASKRRTTWKRDECWTAAQFRNMMHRISCRSSYNLFILLCVLFRPLWYPGFAQNINLTPLPNLLMLLSHVEVNPVTLEQQNEYERKKRPKQLVQHL